MLHKLLRVSCLGGFMKEKTVRHLEQISDTIHLPGDILAGAPILTLVGEKELYLENYKSIIEYTGDMIRIQTKTGRIHIEGKALNINYYTEDTMKITGRIYQINYGNPKP